MAGPQGSGQARQMLRRAMTDAFGDFDVMRRFAIEALNVNVKDRTDRTAGLDTVAEVLIDMMSERGAVASLIAAARAERPGNVKLRKAEQVWGTTYAPFGDFMPPVSFAGNVESIVTRSSGLPSSDSVVSLLGMAEYCVCYLAYGLPGGNRVYGTAFLIGDDLLMTNYHVIKHAIKPFTLLGSAIEAVFDYRSADATVDRFSLKAQDWLVAYGLDELLDGSQGLDYAIVRLDKGVASLPLTGSSTSAVRGVLKPVAYLPVEQEPVLVLQHPYSDLDAGPSTMRLTIGIVTQVADTELRDSANTSEGSSGSPVFNSRMDLIGLHFWGGEGYNVAKRMTAIRADLAANGHAELLG